MFPKSVDVHTKNKTNLSKTILKKSLLLATLLAIPITIFYFIFPDVVIKILFGNEYLGIRNLIGFFGIAMTFFSLSYILALYNLSINKTKFVIPLIIANVIQFFAIYFIHESLLQITLIVTTVMALVFIYMSLYTWRSVKWLNSQ